MFLHRISTVNPKPYGSIQGKRSTKNIQVKDNLNTQPYTQPIFIHMFCLQSACGLGFHRSR